MKEIKKIRVLLLYENYRADAGDMYRNHILRLRAKGFDVKGFCVTLKPPGPRLSFPELDSRWKRNDSELSLLYSRLKNECSDRDVILLFNGCGLHPDFLKELKTFNAYQCFDDPESSDQLSRPVAPSFDACFVGNIASLNQYKGWNCKNIFFRPLGFFEEFISPDVSTGDLRINSRDLDVCLFCERVTGFRGERLDYISQRIPNLYARGKGWPGGFISTVDLLHTYSNTKIGINLHNSTGPINLRTYVLPANGLLQICDNKFFLNDIFKLDVEAVGFNQIEELPELVDFYLKNDHLRTKIAINGWKRAVAEYNEYSVWEKQMYQIGKLL